MMKSASDQILRESPEKEGVVSFLSLTDAAYSSLDVEKLRRLRRLLMDHADRPGPKELVLDLSAVQFFGATFIGILVGTWNCLRKRERQLVLRGLTPYCSNLIARLDLHQLFEVLPGPESSGGDLAIPATWRVGKAADTEPFRPAACRLDGRTCPAPAADN